MDGWPTMVCEYGERKGMYKDTILEAKNFTTFEAYYQPLPCCPGVDTARMRTTRSMQPVSLMLHRLLDIGVHGILLRVSISPAI